jgi:hypothetical protein
MNAEKAIRQNVRMNPRNGSVKSPSQYAQKAATNMMLMEIWKSTSLIA